MNIQLSPMETTKAVAAMNSLTWMIIELLKGNGDNFSFVF